MSTESRGPADGIEATAAYCYLTTTGRTSGEPRTIEIWFGVRDRSLYLLAGSGHDAHWVRNIERDPKGACAHWGPDVRCNGPGPGAR